MVREARGRYNASFTEQRYRAMLDAIDADVDYHVPFRVAESPVFVSQAFFEHMAMASREVLALIAQPGFAARTENAIPPGLRVPGDPGHPLFLTLDFGVCRSENGELLPQLIELQGFPSLFGWEHYLAGRYRRHFDVMDNFSHLFGMDASAYETLLRDTLLGGHPPENVVLLELEPEKQNTFVDFLITERIAGVKPLCLTNLKRSGKELYYEASGKKIPIHRIYNRVIFDELIQRGLLHLFPMQDDLAVEWAGHPNWFYRVSKYVMPMLDSRYVPASAVLNQLNTVPADLENYVLKPLYSFSGSGVMFHVTPSDLDAVKDPSAWMLQRKVAYASAVRTTDESVKTELRLLFIRTSAGLRLTTNMARMSRGDIIGVKHNKDRTWVGGSVGMYEAGCGL